MKNIILSTIVFASLLCIIACDYDYPEEITYNGKNTHGFKLNGEKWVRKPTGFGPSASIYEQENELLGINLYSKKKDVNDSSEVILRFILRKDMNYFISPLKFELFGINDSIESNFYHYENIDTSICFCKFIYEKEQSERVFYSKIISGELQLLRFDTLLVGTFEARLTNGTNTLTLTDGKFDYQLTTE